MKGLIFQLHVPGPAKRRGRPVKSSFLRFLEQGGTSTDGRTNPAGPNRPPGPDPRSRKGKVAASTGRMAPPGSTPKRGAARWMRH